MSHVVVAGYLSLDIIPSFPQQKPLDLRTALVPGEMVAVSDLAFAIGGAVANTGIALSKLGHALTFSALLGDDQIGRLITERLAPWGDMAAVISRADCDSAYTIALAPPGFDRTFLFNAGSNNRFSANDIKWNLAGSATHFHLGYPNIMKNLAADDGRQLASIFEKAKSLGLTTSLDLAVSGGALAASEKDWRAWLTRAMPHVDLFVPSIEEILKLWGPADTDTVIGNDDFVDRVPTETFFQLGSELISAGCALVAIKAGHRGIYVRTGSAERLRRVDHMTSLLRSPDAEFWGSSFSQSNIASAVGAGDAAIAGLIGALSRDMPLAEAVAVANCLGWQNLRRSDGVGGIGDWSETLSLVKTLPTNDSPVAGSWSQTDTPGVLARP